MTRPERVPFLLTSSTRPDTTSWWATSLVTEERIGELLRLEEAALLRQSGSKP